MVHEPKIVRGLTSDPAAQASSAPAAEALALDGSAPSRETVIHVKTALSMLEVLWPGFVERDGMVLLTTSAQQSVELSKFRDRTDAESFYNHVHVFDCFRHAAPASTHPEHGYVVWDMSHPDFERACELGRRMSRMWLAKLAQDYPDRRFRVYWTKLDDPIVRFHQVRDGERPWASDEHAAAQVVAGEALIFETPANSGTSGLTSR